ncbi:hypothetical protein RYH80_11855 [Halobaculum sp. MBLA0147]|uniref:hypothetical protein n=1 Tax=Halobaculum sp. MBLA0147 TaxID=3079934 RepID=UPI003526978E
MRADPADALALWLRRRDVPVVGVRVSARARDRYAARLVPDPAADDHLAAARRAARETSVVEVRRDGMVVFHPSGLLDHLSLTADALGECTHDDCGRAAERYVIFGGGGAVRDYCPTHADRVEALASTGSALG